MGNSISQCDGWNLRGCQDRSVIRPAFPSVLNHRSYLAAFRHLHSLISKQGSLFLPSTSPGRICFIPASPLPPPQSKPSLYHNQMSTAVFQLLSLLDPNTDPASTLIQLSYVLMLNLLYKFLLFFSFSSIRLSSTAFKSKFLRLAFKAFIVFPFGYHT